MKLLHWMLCAVMSLAVVFATQAAWAGPPPFDPKQMSGIPRPDPEVPAGTVTVRVLGEGGFSDPMVGAEVTLEITGADGNTATRTVTATEQGRATFEDLQDFVGGKAVAKVQLGGKSVASMPIDLLPSTGSRVMLVQGAPERVAAGQAPRHGQAGGPEVPAPGVAFPMQGLPIGSLTVGTFDLDARKPVPGVDVELTITVPEGEPVVRTGKSDAQGKVVFEDLLPPTVPAGSELVVKGTLVPEGEEQVSQSFQMRADAGMAVVLAEGAEDVVVPPAPQSAPTRVAPLPGPRVQPTLKAGTVRIRLVDPQGQPVSDQTVKVIKKTAVGDIETWPARTDARGLAEVADVSVQQDALYFVEAIHQGAPYQSSFFGMDRRGGIDVALRVWPTTSDRSVVRSALQIDMQELENNNAQVVQIYEVMVQGDKAFWDPELRIEGIEGAKGLVVLRPAEDWLEHEESAPHATLHGPIPPGQVTNLSIGYIVEHDGSVEFEWTPPFEIVESSVLVGEDLELQAPNATKSELASPLPNKTVYTLGSRTAGTPIELTMEGLRVRDPIFERVAAIGAFVIAALVVLGIALAPRTSNRDRLVRQRDELLALLEQADHDVPGRERERVLVLLDRVYRQLDALGVERPKSESAPSAPAKEG